MIGSLKISNRICWWRTGNAELLSKTGNVPTRRALTKRKRTQLADGRSQGSKLDAQKHSIDETTTNEHHLNPHSSINTIQTHRMRPRGFLP